jgi:Cyclin-dependent kinase inhibitor 3 (CDKN3)
MIDFLPDSIAVATARAEVARALGSARLGMTSCPGFHGPDARAHLAEIADAGGSVLLSLVEDDELWLYGAARPLGGIEGFARAVEHAGLELVRHPIVDRGVPAELEAWIDTIVHVATILRGGRTVVVHCGAGIGRTCAKDARRIETEPQRMFADATARALGLRHLTR